MIDGLDADDSRLERMVVLVNVSDQLQLCGRRPDNESFLGTLERPGDLVEESLGVFGCSLAPWGPLGCFLWTL
jgi:hypothetical protein